MAHECPVCGKKCYCNGDIDDIVNDEINCICCSDVDDWDRQKGSSHTIFVHSFLAGWRSIQSAVHQTAIDKGWYSDGEHNLGELIALCHAELSEALEALRHGNPPAEHIKGFSAVEEELADVVIRVLDLAAYQGYRVGDAIIAKMEFNKTRPERHGGKCF